MRGASYMEILIATIFTAIVVAMIWSASYNALHPCLRLGPETGSVNCWGNSGYMHCEQDRECLERAP